MARICVTGASGFIGHHLTQQLLDGGETVAVTTRYANVVRCPRLRDMWDDLEILEVDVRNGSAVHDRLAEFGPELVYHLAAYNHVGQSWSQVEECFDVNAKGSANVIDAASRVGAHVIYVSSSEVYGLQEETPWHEELRPNPQSPYAVTKLAGELYALAKQRQGMAQVGVVRPFNTFGPGQSSKAVIAEFIIKALRGETIVMTAGTQTREFNYVSDTVRGLLAAGTTRFTGGPINLGCGSDVSILDLVTFILRITESTSSVEHSLPARPNEIMQMYASTTLAKDVLDWEPSIDLLQGLTKTVAWFRDHLQVV